ncbi:MAG: phosphodiester glycosidase family protein [Clostridia bacterium]|nr:phosphodiester glycosidase family protein [Clostridia bacterium]
MIYDPSRIEVVTTKYLGKDGQYLTTISEENNALLAINAGGFEDPTGHGTGGTPLGITISNRKLIYDGKSTPKNIQGGLIGITKDNKLYLGNISSKQALLMGIRSSVSFGPYLIINGQKADIIGNGGAGQAPRTAIGQRKDGIMLFLVLDGNRTLAKGASYSDVLKIMENYGAHNATCLDGGTSTGMTIKNKFINNPTTQSGANKSRPIPTAFILKADDSDDGDYSTIR